MRVPASLLLLLLTAGIAAPAAYAQRVPIAQEVRAVDLSNGQFGWDEGAFGATDGGLVELVISVPAQRAYVYREGRLIGATTVSTGKRGKETPLGLFEILQKRQFHRSNLYSNAPMPFMQRLTWSGIALHGGDLPGYPASHGCIRMPNAFAKRLFALTELGGRVLVTDQRLPDPAEAPPVLEVSRDQYESERFAVATDDDRLIPIAGTPLYAPNKPVVQSAPDQ